MRRLFTVDDDYRMAEAGILRHGERVELLKGEIVQIAAIASRHAGCVNRLNRILVTGVGPEALVTIHNPVRLSDISEPQPDVAVVRPRPDDDMERHPLPDDVLLVVEVADSSVPVDRERKAPLCATGYRTRRYADRCRTAPAGSPAASYSRDRLKWAAPRSGSISSARR